MSEKLYLDAPNIGDLEKYYLNQAVESTYISTVGPFVDEFELNCSKYLGVENSVSTNSGTSALHIALHELGIGRGDEVIVPTLTFVASVNPVIYCGAEPVFVDVDIKTWNMDITALEKAISAKTKAIIPVHLYGNPCDMDQIMRIADKHGLYVVEDATESLGAKYHDMYTGTIGDMGCFSFNGNKTITTGGGGLVISKYRERLKHIKYLVNQAKDYGVEMYHSEIGFNYRMTNISAALGIAQLQRLKEFLQIKKNIHHIYNKELGSISNIKLQAQYDEGDSSWWFTCILMDDERARLQLQDLLQISGIPFRRIFSPVHKFTPFKDCRFSGGDNAETLYKRGICLPSSTLNSEEGIDYVCQVIKRFFQC